MRCCKSSRTDKDPGGDDDDDDDDEPQQTSAVIAGNDDLLSEILLRLPVKSILRFKSVSKRWLSLISDPHFSQDHCRRNPASVSGLFLRKSSSAMNPEFDFVSLDGNRTGIPFRSLSFNYNARFMRIGQSCNGLFCCSNFRASEMKRTYYIYNPATNQHTTLLRPVGTIVDDIHLAFDPLKSPHYKAICVQRYDKSFERYQIEIYSSETGSWRTSGDPFFAPFELKVCNAVYWNGAIHFVLGGPSLYFDIEREILLTMPMPPIPEGRNDYERRIRYFGESRGHLHLIVIYNPPATQFDVLEMESDYSKWFVKYRVDLDALTTAYPQMVPYNKYAFSVICLVRGEKEEEASSLVLNIPGKVISYNLNDKIFKKLCDLQPSLVGNSVRCFDEAYQYFETLSCV